MKHAIVAGTFEIGEKVRDAQLRAVECARNTDRDIILLVNDIGLPQKLLAYEAGNTAGVNALYAERLACAKSGCQISQLPKTEQEIDAFRDDEALQSMLKVLRAYTDSRDPVDVARVCRNVIVPEQIRKRIALYRLEGRQVLVYTERSLRNMVSNSLHGRYAQRAESLVPVIHYAQKHHQGVALLLEELQSRNRIPTCRAIMLQLYIQLSREGYIAVEMIQESIHQLAFENAAELYTQLKKIVPDDPRFQLEITHDTVVQNSEFCIKEIV